MDLPDIQQPSPELRARLRAAGVTDDASLQTAITADPDLRRDFFALFQPIFDALASLEVVQFDELWQQIPPGLEDAFLDAAETRAATLSQAGQPAKSTRLYERAEALRTVQALRHSIRDAPPATQALLLFLEAPTDTEARQVFEQHSVLLKPYEMQHSLDQLAQQESEERGHYAARAELLWSLRSASARADPPQASPATHPLRHMTFDQLSSRHAAYYAAAMEHANNAQQHHTMLPEVGQLSHAFAWAADNDLVRALGLAASSAELQAAFGLARDRLAWAEQALEAAKQRGGAETVAHAYGGLGNALQIAAALFAEERPARLRAALNAYEGALDYYTPETTPLDYAAAQNNRAGPLQGLARLAGKNQKGLLREALAAYDTALRFYSPETTPLQYAVAQNNRAALLQDLAELAGEDRERRLREALEGYDAALRFRTPETVPLDYATTQNNRATLLRDLAELAGEDRPRRLRAALDAYDAALLFRTPETAPLDYATTQNNRAALLQELAELAGEDRPRRLRAALDAYDAALRFCTPETDPLGYATNQNNRAALLQELAELAGEDRPRRLRAALDAYDAALRFRTPETDPLEYAATQNNRAALLRELAGLTGKDRDKLLRSALAGYDTALRFRTPETDPLRYAATQNNRAALLRDLAELPGEDRAGWLRAALAAYDTALRFYTPETVPFDHAWTQNNRAVVLQDLARLPGEDRGGRLREALAACDAALRFRTPETAPLRYAATQNNRAALFQDLAELAGEDRRTRLLEALDAYNTPLHFCTPEAASLQYAATQNNRAVVLRDLAELAGEDRSRRLHEALESYDAALRFRTPETTPLDYAMTINNRAILLRDLAALPVENRLAHLREALRLGWEALGWFERLAHMPSTETARQVLRSTKKACGADFAALWAGLEVGPPPAWLADEASLQTDIPELRAFKQRLQQYGTLLEAAAESQNDIAAWQAAAAAGEALLEPKFASLSQVNRDALLDHLARTYIGLALAYDDVGQWEQALAANDRAVALQPDVALLRRNRTSLLMSLGRWEEAVEELERARGLEPEAPSLVELEADLAKARASKRRARRGTSMLSRLRLFHKAEQRTIAEQRTMKGTSMHQPDITGPACRLCGAPLPSRGWRRTCAQCGSTHIYPLYGFSRNIVVGAMGLFFLMVGLTVALLAVSFSVGLGREAELAREPALRSVAEVAAAPPKQTVLLEGRISASNPPVYQQLVAYERDVDTGKGPSSRGRRTPSWMDDGQRTPKLLLDMSDGPLRLDSDIYLLSGNLHVLYATEEGKPRRYSGLQAGDAVLVFVRVATVRGDPVVSPSKIFVGSRAEFIAGASSGRSVSAVCGVVFVGLWAGLGLFLVRMLWRHAESLGLQFRR